MMAGQGTALVGDIGATNARFGLVSDTGAILDSGTFDVADFAEIGLAIEAYFAGLSGLSKPTRGALAIAAAITGDEIRMTNHPWHFSVEALRRRLGLAQLLVINDFTAVALALPRLTAADRLAVGGSDTVEGQPIGVLGPGSGLGVSGLVRVPGSALAQWVALTGEGGHMTMAASSEREEGVLRLMRRRFDHVSAERVLSGPGLVNLYNALAELDRVPAAQYTAAQVTDPQLGAQDRHCAEATAMFCAMLGTVAGDLALTLGARGGVYIAGGIVPRLGARFGASGFRARFEKKGRLSPYLAAIPTWVITHKLPAFLGCAAALEQA
ncbi:MAG: glucokinase [Thiohalocapsa sp.]